MKTYTHCPKCNQPLTLVGYFGLVAIARCECDYAAPGAEGSSFWRGIHVMDSRWLPESAKAAESEESEEVDQ